MRIRSSADSANGLRLPIAALRSTPRPRRASEASCIQVWNAARVGSSKARKISSSCTALETWAAGSVAVLGQHPVVRVAGGELDVGLAEQRLLPQDRPRVGRDRRELGVDLERRVGELPASESSIALTLPTETPEIRTSDSTASWVASWNGTVTR